MKAKKFNKKLALNKKTIANLKQDEMGDALGGGSQKICSVSFCPECPPDPSWHTNGLCTCGVCSEHIC